MPYNGSGTYSAPSNSWNPAVAGTAISATDWIAVLADLQTAFSTAICKDGQTTTTTYIPFAAGLSSKAGAVGSPAFYMGTDTTTGFYRPAANQVGVTVSGVLKQLTTATDLTLSQNLLFTDATYDIGASGATRPRDFFLSRNATVGGTLALTGAMTYGGVTLTAAVTGTGKMVLDTSPTIDSAVGKGTWTASGTWTLPGVTFNAAVNFDAGTVAAPGLYLEGETGTGLYRIGANNHGYAVSGSKVLDIASTGLSVIGTLGVSSLIKTTGASGGVSIQAELPSTGDVVLSLKNTTKEWQLYNSADSLRVYRAGDGDKATFSATGLSVIGTLGVTNNIDLTEMTAPSGTANTARIFAVDNGSGKTVLKVIFGSGAAQVIATEP